MRTEAREAPTPSEGQSAGAPRAPANDAAAHSTEIFVPPIATPLVNPRRAVDRTALPVERPRSSPPTTPPPARGTGSARQVMSPDDEEPGGSSRTTESALTMPALGQTLRVLGRAFRLRCPHCGGAPVLAAWRPGRAWAEVRPACARCGFRYERSADHYFGGAMFVNLMMAEGIFFVSFVSAMLVTWPNVPWDALTYGGAAAMLLFPVLFFPVAKVCWLAVDVLVRPVSAAELAGTPVDT